MPEIYPKRMTAEIEGPFVVFLIGMRINRPWKIHKWLPVAMAMPRMLKELERHPQAGLLGYTQSLTFIVQYWRSFEQLETYARSKDYTHWPAWLEFNKKVRATSGDVGIWHETYLVEAGQYEAIYGGMPRYGLAKAGRHVEVAGRRDSARARLAPALPEAEA